MTSTRETSSMQVIYMSGAQLRARVRKKWTRFEEARDERVQRFVFFWPNAHVSWSFTRLRFTSTPPLVQTLSFNSRGFFFFVASARE